MRKIAVAGISALSIAAGSVAVAAVVPMGSALAQDSGTTTTAPSAGAPDAAQAPKGEHGGKGRLAKRFGAKLEDIATYLGTDVAGLREQLKTKSLGEIAGDKKAGLVQMLVDQANTRIDEAVTKGKLTAEQATKLKAGAATRITALVDHVGGGHGPGDHAKRGPFGGGRRGR